MLVTGEDSAVCSGGHESSMSRGANRKTDTAAALKYIGQEGTDATSDLAVWRKADAEEGANQLVLPSCIPEASVIDTWILP